MVNTWRGGAVHYMTTKFSVDNSSRFPFTAHRTNGSATTSMGSDTDQYLTLCTESKTMQPHKSSLEIPGIHSPQFQELIDSTQKEL